jgi:O-antigen ligase
MAIKVVHPDRQALNWLVVGGSLVSIFIWASLDDPFNAPKSWVLYCVGFWLFGWVAFQVRTRWSTKVERQVLALSAVFALTLIGAFLATDVKLQGLFGDYARRTGLLTYLSLITFFIAGSFLFSISNIATFDRVTLVTGFVIGFYGFLQHFKVDVIKWNNPYNSVLSTLGNPDFAAAVMAIFMVLAFGLVLNGSKSTLVRVWSVVNVLLLLVTIVFSEVRQGLLAGAAGIGVIVFIWIHQRQWVAAWLLAGIGLVGGIAGLIGMLNQGPLKSFFYKVSVTYRGDYWRAGVRMFKSHPWFGVGLDRYGNYFRQYRDITQVLRRGPATVSNAAHDVPIQLAATGGIFVLIGFLLITGFVAWRGVIALRSTSGFNQIVVATFFGAWITYEAQSLISIDNVGIAIWGWILGGIVVALSKPAVLDAVTAPVKSRPRSAKKNYVAIKSSKPSGSGSLAQPLVSGLLFTLALALCVPLFLIDSSLRAANSYAVPTSASIQPYLQQIRKPLAYGYQDAHAKVAVGILLAQANQIPEGKANLNAVAKTDPRSFDALNALALIDEQTKNFASAIGYRQKMTTLDPYNYQNLLQLGEDLKNTGDKAGAKAIIARINAFAPKTQEAATAQKDFGSL